MRLREVGRDKGRERFHLDNALPFGTLNSMTARPLSIAFVLGLLLLAPRASFAQTIYTPPAGSAERKAIMNVLRVPAERDLHQPIVFRVQHLKVSGDWAFARVVPIQPNGRDLNYARTRYAQENADGVFDGEAETLLRRRAGQWRILEYRFGATDTITDEWLKQYRFPRALLEE